MTGRRPSWLSVRRGEVPLVVSLPHTGTEIEPSIADRLLSVARAQLDTDWWIERLYDFAADLGATIIRTEISRTVIDVNRDPSGNSFYPGQTTTGLCPLTTFDGEPLYRPGAEPGAAEIALRRDTYFAPYHAALAEEIAVLRSRHAKVVLYDCHSIRSIIPRLFEGTLPHLNIGTNAGKSCDPRLAEAIVALCAASPFSHVVDGRFRGGWITRRYGQPAEGVHAVQMELACRTYLAGEPLSATPENWPVAYDPRAAAPARVALTKILGACLAFTAA